MATSSNTPIFSRRAMFGGGGVVVAAALVVIPASALPSGDGEFQSHLSDYRRAHGEFVRAAGQGDDALTSVACGKSEDAFARLLAHPAPNIRAVETKLAIIIDEYDDCEFDASRLDCIIADLRRLASN